VIISFTRNVQRCGKRATAIKEEQSNRI